MKLTQYTDYSLRSLMYISEHQGRLVTISEIANYHSISRNHIVKVIHQLATRGYLETLRGKNGGIRLARPASDIRVGDVVLDMEPGMDMVECLSGNSSCTLSPHCRLKGAIQQATQTFIDSLNGVSLADLAVTADVGKKIHD